MIGTNTKIAGGLALALLSSVALAAGGFLGIGLKISDDEERVLNDLAKTFNV